MRGQPRWSTSLLGLRVRPALLLLSSVFVASAAVAVGRHLWVEAGSSSIQSIQQAMSGLLGTFVVFAAGGLLAAILSWIVHRDKDRKRSRRSHLLAAASGNAIAALAGSAVLLLMIWDVTQVLLVVGSLAVFGTGLFWSSFAMDDHLQRRRSRAAL